MVGRKPVSPYPSSLLKMANEWLSSPPAVMDGDLWDADETLHSLLLSFQRQAVHLCVPACGQVTGVERARGWGWHQET